MKILIKIKIHRKSENIILYLFTRLKNLFKLIKNIGN